MTWLSSQGYQMWTCEKCGCLGIAASLTACPMCFQERDMAKITVGGGPSDAQTAERALAEAEAAERAPAKPPKAKAATRTPVAAKSGTGAG